MEFAGWYKHCRQWRKRGLITMSKRNQIPSLNAVFGADMETAIARRLLAQDDGTLCDAYGANIAKHALEALIKQITDNPRRKEAIRRKVAILTEELAGPNPAAIEKLLAGRVALCWLDSHYMDMMSYLSMGVVAPDSTVGEYYQRRQNRAHRRLISASKALAVCRRLAFDSVRAQVTSASLLIPS
jgi:hypothetical protein